MRSLIATLWAKISFWKRLQNKLQHNIDYVLIDFDNGKKTGVSILKGKYAGILYHYGKVKIAEEEMFAKMTFDYTIVTTPKIVVEELIKDDEFLNLIGDILTDILMNQRIKNEETGNYDSEEFDI
jgi:hypothetical protein